MKKIFPNIRSIVYFLSIIVASFLGYMAGRSLHKLEGAEPIINGILSAATLLLIFILFLAPKKPMGVEGIDEIEIDYKVILRHSTLFFFLLIICTWALQYIIDALRYVLALL